MPRKLQEKIMSQARPLVLQQRLKGAALAQALGVDERTAREYAKHVQIEASARHGHEPDPSPDTAVAEEPPGPHTGVWTPDQPALVSHPLADLFPTLDDSDLAALTADIAAQGLREPIWLYDGRILDGRNRYRACQALGLACPTREYVGENPLSLVLSMNLHRRHLTESQRAMVAAKLANMRQGARTDVRPRVNLPEVSNAQAAETLNISESLVKHAKKVQAEAQPEVIKAVEGGHMAVSAAAKLANEPVAVQRAVVKTLETGAAKTVPEALTRVQGAPNGRLPTRAEGRWVDPLAPVHSSLREMLGGFDSLGGMAAIIRAWSPEQRQNFDRRVDIVEALWTRFINEFRAIREAVILTEANDAPDGL
jgi:hypothetical protein